MKIALVACAKTKLSVGAAARDLYVSPLFKKSLAYAERNADRVFILSAEHGLLQLDAHVEPYNHTLAEKSREGRARWGKAVGDTLVNLFKGDDVEVVLLAGKLYSEPLALPAHWKRTEPLKGLELGQRLQRLNALLG